MILVCENCGKEFNTYYPNRSKHHFCSRECSAESRKSVIEVRCDFCDKVFLRKNNALFTKSKNHFCSRECANGFQSKNKVEFVCKVCGNKFYRSKSWLHQKSGFYCSLGCRDADEEWTKKSHIKANLVQCHKTGLNKVELKGNEILDRFDLIYETQVLINEKICVDVFIPEYNLIIQWDGDYWHGKDMLYENLDNRQKKRVDLDKSQDAYLKKCGYYELRFWESEVMGNEDCVYENIKRAISEIARRV